MVTAYLSEKEMKSHRWWLDELRWSQLEDNKLGIRVQSEMRNSKFIMKLLSELEIKEKERHGETVDHLHSPLISKIISQQRGGGEWKAKKSEVEEVKVVAEMESILEAAAVGCDSCCAAATSTEDLVRRSCPDSLRVV